MLTSVLALGPLLAAEQADIPVAVLGLACHLWAASEATSRDDDPGTVWWRYEGAGLIYEVARVACGLPVRTWSPENFPMMGDRLLFGSAPRLEPQRVLLVAAKPLFAMPGGAEQPLVASAVARLGALQRADPEGDLPGQLMRYLGDLARSDLSPADAADPVGPEAAAGFGLWPLPPADLDLDRVGPLDPAAAQVCYVVPFGEKNVLVSEVALDLLRAARAGRDVAGIGRDLGARASGPAGTPGPDGVVPAEQVRSAYQQVLSNLPEAGGPRRNSRLGLWCVTPLLPASVVRAVADRLTGVFASWFAWPALAVSIAAIAVAW